MAFLMTLIDVFETPHSSMLKQAEYAPTARLLHLTYKDGATWDYEDVPPDVWAAMKAAESVGKFVAAKIKPVYKATKVSGKAQTSEGVV